MRKQSLLVLMTFVFCFVFLIYKAESATYYLDAVNGDDANPGSESQPWKTPTKAGNTAVAGDTVLFKPGTYTAQLAPVNSGSAGNLITFKAQTRRTAILDGGGQIS